VSAREAYLGIDLGTTAVKAALVEGETGCLIAGAGRRISTTVHAHGEREQRPGEILGAVGSVIAELRKQAGGKWRNVAGVSLASQGGSAVIARRETGEALTEMWPWNDARPFAYMHKVEKKLGRAFWRRHTMRDDGGAGLGRMLWLRQTRPEVVTTRNIYAGAGEFVFYQLTGVWRQDAGSALQVGCYDARKRTLMREPLDAVGVPETFVAAMREGHETAPMTREAAKRFGLAEGTPVAGPYMDHEAGFMAAAGISPRPLQCSLGTAWVGNFLMKRSAKWSNPFQLVIPSPIDDGWQVVQPMLTGNVTWEWGLAAFVHGDRKKALAGAARMLDEATPGGGVVCVPWLGRPNPFCEGAFGAGAFVGVNPATTHADMLKALAAGMAFEFYRVFEEVHRKRIVDSLVLGGGAAGAEFFRKMFAALFAPVPVYVFEDHEYAGARGAVRPFDAKAGKAAVRAVGRPGVRFAAEALRAYEDYRRVFERLYGDVGCAGPARVEAR